MNLERSRRLCAKTVSVRNDAGDKEKQNKRDGLLSGICRAVSARFHDVYFA